MKTTLPPEVEAGRIAGDRGAGPYGAFRLTHPDTGRTLQIIASDGRDWAAEGLVWPVWEHVSVSTGTTVPRWEEMRWVKGLFWEPEEWVVQYHPAAASYVNVHERVLHLWKPVGVSIPVPPIETV